MGCAACGAELGVDARFCSQCGAVVASQAPLEGERRQVTVLFADLVDSTRLSQEIDAEEMGEAVLAYQESGRRVMEAEGGHVANYLGDGLLVLFGYPRAHEDDALRAVTAGLRLAEELEALRQRFPAVALAARIGIHSGLAVVGAMGSDQRTDTSAFGDTPNIAARVEGAARPGTVVVSDATLELVERYVVVESLGPHDLKGVRDAIGLHRVVDVVAGDAAARRSTPFVGRTDELDLLVRAWQEVKAGTSRTVVVRGEAGLGKSRLVTELYDRLEVADVNRLRGTCSPVGVHSEYHPFVTMIERFAGVGSTTPADVRVKAIEAFLGQWQLHDDALLALLGIGSPVLPASPGVVRHRTERALLDTLDRVLAVGPTALFVDDLHWADPSSLELLDRLVAERRPGLLILATARPEAAWAPPSEGCQVIELGPLDRRSSERIVRLVSGDLDETAAAELIERADGVPLFIEELTRSVASRRDQPVPSTLHDSLMARLDDLGEARRLVQVASVVGRDVARSVLEALVGGERSDDDPDDQLDDHLAAIVDAGLFVAHATAEDSFTFRHALIQDAAYESLLRRERRVLHTRIGDMLEAENDAPAAIVAHHRVGAEDHVAAGRWFHRAGRHAALRGAYREALGHFRRGLEALAMAEAGRDRDRVELDLQLMIGNAAQAIEGFGTPDNEVVWNRARALAAELGDLDEMTSAMNGLVVLHFDQGDVERGHELSDEILRCSIETGDSRAGRVRGHTSVSLVSLYRGDLRRAFEVSAKAVDEYRPSDFHDLTYGIGVDQGVVAHGVRAWSGWFLGQDGPSVDHARRSVQLGRDLDSAISAAMGLTLSCIVHLLREEFEVVAEQAEELVTIGEVLGSVQPRGFGRMLGGAAETRLGPGSSAAATMRDGMDILSQGGSGQGGAPIAFAVLSGAHLALDAWQDAFDMADLGLAVSAASRQPFVDAELLRNRALARAGLGAAPAEIDADLGEAARCARALDAFASELLVALARVDLVGSGAHEPLAEVVARAPQTADSPALRRARKILSVDQEVHP